MRKHTIPGSWPVVVLLLFLLCSCVGALGEAAGGRDKKEQQTGTEQQTEVSEKMLDKIHWLGHACFRIDTDKIVYFDPFELKENAVPADIVFISHAHMDHCSPKDMKIIQKKGTVIVTTADCAEKISGEKITVKPGDTLTVEGLRVEVVPAYNIDKKFHPKKKEWVGFVVTIEGHRIYHAGDTDFIPEMKSIDADIAFLPVSGTYVMTAEEAVKAAETIEPRLAIPMHYGSIVGDEKDAQAFKKKCSVPVKIMERE
jgi:L-ascorbate metabolism protein UlaG (beta-lactamase superfamily)